MSEAELQKAVLQLCRHMGLLTYHTYDSRRSQPGFPDLVIVGARGMLFRELKTGSGRLRAEQVQWIKALQAIGVNAAVWRPSDWPTRIQKELAALGSLGIRPPQPSQAEIRARLQRGQG